MKGRAIEYTEEQLLFLQRFSGMPRKELTQLFNNEFNRDVPVGAIKGLCQRNGWKADSNGRFYKGQPYNPKTRPKGPNKGSFKKGNKPINIYDPGRVKITKDGLEIKLNNPKKWIDIKWAVYTSLIGPVPEGGLITSLDGNRYNIDPNNLMVIDTRINGAISKYRSKDKEITRATINRKKLELLTKDIENDR